MNADDAARFEPDPCYCGQPASQLVEVGSHLVDGLWVPEHEAACDRCSLISWAEREWVRSS